MSANADTLYRADDLETFVLVNVGSVYRPNAFAKISPCDAEIVLRHKWSLTRGGQGCDYVRAIDRLNNNRQIKLHRYLLAAPDGVHVDHVNGDGLDNRRCNIRIATCQQNQFNSAKHIHGSSQFKGVAWCRIGNKWRAYISINRRQSHIGMFENELDAAAAYDRRAKELFGEFARINLG